MKRHTCWWSASWSMLYEMERRTTQTSSSFSISEYGNRVSSCGADGEVRWNCVAHQYHRACSGGHKSPASWNARRHRLWYHVVSLHQGETHRTQQTPRRKLSRTVGLLCSWRGDGYPRRLAENGSNDLCRIVWPAKVHQFECRQIHDLHKEERQATTREVASSDGQKSAPSASQSVPGSDAGRWNRTLVRHWSIYSAAACGELRHNEAVICFRGRSESVLIREEDFIVIMSSRR